jgi:methionyl-tRNA synthetase
MTIEASAARPSYYLTTPIYYVNGVPHLGTAYTTIAADALARFERMDGQDTWFLTGLDEHGQKVAQTAEAAGVTPQEWVDSVAPQFKHAWHELNITNDDFIRTTEERHIRGVQQFFEALHNNGYLYKSTYKGWYCVPEETFFTSEQLADDNQHLCPDCGRPLTYVEEENWFFKLSAFQDRLLAFYDANPGFISPQTRNNEVVSFVKSGLKDLSVSRTTFDWGVPIPFDPKHVSYVWVDALINYLTAVGYGSDSPQDQQMFAQRWPAQIHFVGKDIIRFHCVIWPAMLMAAGIEPPRKVFAHGFLLTKGEKMSKSKGNAMSPLELAAIFSVDAYRYYFLSDVQFGADGSISLERMLQVYNADLANSWGNLCSRVFNMTQKYFDSKVPTLWDKTVAHLTREKGNPLRDIASGLYTRCAVAMNELDYTTALAAVMELCNRANLYIEESAPWTLAKAVAAERAATIPTKAAAERAATPATPVDSATPATPTATAAAPTTPTAEDHLAFVLYNALEAIRIMALLYAPVMPNTSAEVYRRLGLEDIFATTNLATAVAWGTLPANNQITPGTPLFPRLQLEDLT